MNININTVRIIENMEQKYIKKSKINYNKHTERNGY